MFGPKAPKWLHPCQHVALPPNDDVSDASTQSFQVAKPAVSALADAKTYLSGAGDVAPGLKGSLLEDGDGIVVHHGRVQTRISALDTDDGADVRVERSGTAPLAETRTWVFAAGIIGFVLAWGLAWYNANNGGLAPLVTISLFFLAMTAVVTVLYVVDRSLETRGASLCRSLQDAMEGNPETILRREIDALERTSSIANGVLFYCASLIVEFLVFVVLLSEGIREGIDEAVTFEVMKAGFGIPLIPAVLFGLGWFYYTNRVHKDRFALRETEQ